MPHITVVVVGVLSMHEQADGKPPSFCSVYEQDFQLAAVSAAARLSTKEEVVVTTEVEVCVCVFQCVQVLH